MTDVDVGSVRQETEEQTPITAEAAIDFCIRQLRRAPDIITERHRAYQELKAAFDLKWAMVADATDGTELAKKRAATIACAEDREAMDTAYRAYQYAKTRTRALEKELSGLQSVNKSVTSAYDTYGRGR